MSKLFTICLLLGLISCDERSELLARQNIVKQELSDLKIQAYGFQGNSTSVDSIMERTQALIKESDELKQKLSVVDLQLPQVTSLDSMVPDDVDTKKTEDVASELVEEQIAENQPEEPKIEESVAD